MALATELLLGIGILVLFVILLVVNVYIIVYFQKPGEKRDNIWTKLLIISGFQLTSFTVMMVAVDSANNSGNPMCDASYPSVSDKLFCGDIDFEMVWRVLFLAIGVYLVILIPFATFYYDADADIDDKSPFKEACCYSTLLLAILACIVVPLYEFSDEKFTLVPLREYSVNLSDMTVNTYMGPTGNSIIGYIDEAGGMQIVTKTLDHAGSVESEFTYAVGFDIYLVSLISWVGWFIFSIFAGAGLAALPFDLIAAYFYRPKPLDHQELTSRKMDLQMRANEILETSLQLKKGRSDSNSISKATRIMSDRIEVNKLTNMMYALEQEVEELEACKNINKSYNPLLPYLSLLFGFIAAIISILWVLQIVLYNLADEVPLLNDYLQSFDSWFPMFGLVTYAIFSIYMLLCTIKGCFKVGMRCLCCCQIHAMAVAKTEVNSFLFNLAVVMLCSAPLVHFLSQSFSGYASYSSAYLLFDVQIKNMSFFAPMFQQHIFTYIILGMCGLTTLVLAFKPRDVDQFGSNGATKTKTNKDRERAAAGGNYELTKI